MEKSTLTSHLNNEELTLEEKLALIDEMMKNPVKVIEKDGARVEVPVDPDSLLQCDGCS